MRDEDKSKDELLKEIALLRLRLGRVAGSEDGGTESRQPRLRVLLENSPDVITVLDLDAYLLYINHGGARQVRTIELLGSRATDQLHPDDHERYLAAFKQAIATRSTQRVLVTSVTGSIWEARLVPLLEDGQVFAVMGIGTDITQRRRVESALSESQEKLRLTVEATGIGLWKWDAKTEEISWDGASSKVLGVAAAALPKNFAEYTTLVHPEERSRITRSFARATRLRAWDALEHRVVKENGEIGTLVLAGSPSLAPNGELLGFLGGVFDITERKRLEEQLRQAQKMEALGQLTAGIAHNFNNMLTVILSNVHLCVSSAPEPLAQRLRDAEHAARRAADMVRELMVFARRYPVTRKHAIDVREIVRRTADICLTTFDKNIEIDVAAAEAALPVLADPGQLEQVLLNICLNARDAFEGHDNTHPTICISTDIVMRKIEAAHIEQICITIRDNGPGMSEDVRRRIFEPFFTTKEVGRGTGLGLATAYGIVADHGGEIECVSRPGKGASFVVRLPSASSSSDSQSTFHAVRRVADA